MEVVSVDDQTQQQNKQQCMTLSADYTTAQIHSKRTSTTGGVTGGGNSGDMSRFFSSSDSEDDNIKLTSSQSVVSVNTKRAQKTSQLSRRRAGDSMRRTGASSSSSDTSDDSDSTAGVTRSVSSRKSVPQSAVSDTLADSTASHKPSLDTHQAQSLNGTKKQSKNKTFHSSSVAESVNKPANDDELNTVISSRHSVCNNPNTNSQTPTKSSAAVTELSTPAAPVGDLASILRGAADSIKSGNMTEQFAVLLETAAQIIKSAGAQSAHTQTDTGGKAVSTRRDKAELEPVTLVFSDTEQCAIAAESTNRHNNSSSSTSCSVVSSTPLSAADSTKSATSTDEGTTVHKSVSSSSSDSVSSDSVSSDNSSSGESDSDSFVTLEKQTDVQKKAVTESDLSKNSTTVNTTHNAISQRDDELSSSSSSESESESGDAGEETLISARVERATNQSSVTTRNGTTTSNAITTINKASDPGSTLSDNNTSQNNKKLSANKTRGEKILTVSEKRVLANQKRLQALNEKQKEISSQQKAIKLSLNNLVCYIATW